MAFENEAQTRRQTTTSVREYQSGIVACWSDSGDVVDFCQVLLNQVQTGDMSCVFLFHSQDHYDADTLLSALSDLPDSVALCGCSTAGELTPTGLGDRGIVALLLPRKHFSVASAVLENVNQLGMDDIVSQVQTLKQALVEKSGPTEFGDVFAINLIDGLSYSEEAVTAALHRGLVNIPLIGGSAADNLKFEKTTQIHNLKNYTGSAVLVLVQSRIPFQIFTNNNFVPTDNKLVVTASDLEHRNVQEFNAEPAAVVYARAIGLDPDSLTPTSFASHPVVVKVGGEYYCRSIQKCEEDGSLTFFCAIDNGIVLTIARPEGMVKSTHDALVSIRESLGEIDMILGFDCILRRLDAKNRNTLSKISELYMDSNVIGFGTYGEQFNSMHINQTFTGIAFGTAPR